MTKTTIRDYIYVDRNQTVSIISSADDAELGDPRNSFQKKKCQIPGSQGQKTPELHSFRGAVQENCGLSEMLKPSLASSPSQPAKCCRLLPQGQKEKPTTHWGSTSIHIPVPGKHQG